MTHFLELNLSEFNIDQDFTHTTPAKPSVICICCLATNVPCIKLINCKHVSFFESFFQDKMEYLKTIVCYQCHELLKKFDLFRQQVEESVNILNMQPQQMTINKFQNIELTPINMLSVSPIDMKTSLISAMHTPSHYNQPIGSDLKNNQTNTTSIPDDHNQKAIIVNVKSESTNQVQCETTTDIKMEVESCSDIEIDVPLLDFKEDTSIEKKPKDIKFQPVHERYKSLKDIEFKPVQERYKRDQMQHTEFKPVQKSYKGAQPIDIEFEPIYERNKGQQLKDIKITEFKPVHESEKVKLPLEFDFIPPYEGKVKIITLTMEELMSERDKDRLDEKYLKLPYKCETCITAFDHELVLKNHVMKRHTLKPGGTVCHLCQSVFGPNPHAFKEHFNRHFTRYDCVECGKRYNTMLGATTHCSKVHGNMTTSYQCQKCDFTTEAYSQYRYHKMKHKQPVPCPRCDKTFVSAAGLRTHTLITHEESDRVYTCETCSKEYRHKSALRAHRRAAHDEAARARAYCAPCKAHFATESSLSYHLKYSSRHLADSAKRFECGECGKRYPLKCILLDHINGMHLKRYWYQCNKCDEKFLRKAYLRTHKLTAHEEGGVPRDKICHHCGRGFTTNHILESHIRTHTGERPLQCARCPATFAHPAARYNHIKLVHNRKKPAAVCEPVTIE